MNLVDLLNSDDPHYISRDGRQVPFPRTELEALADYCDEFELQRLRVPIYVSTDPSGAGSWKIEGRLEVAVASRILDREPLREDLLKFYHPHLRDLRRRFPSCFNILYTP